MGSREQIYIVIPAYNEATVLQSVLEELKKQSAATIIVVDDGSTDATFITAKEAGVVALRHSLNRGKGAAVKTGIEAAKLLGAQVVITFDADGQHDPADIAGMLALLEEGNDVVLGKRNFSEKQIPVYKRIANYVGNVATWIIYGLWVNDSQSGLRAYSQKAISAIETQTDRYEYDSEVIREIARHGLRWVEYPMHVRYTPYSMHKIHKQSFTNGLRTLLRMVISESL